MRVGVRVRVQEGGRVKHGGKVRVQDTGISIIGCIHGDGIGMVRWVACGMGWGCKGG